MDTKNYKTNLYGIYDKIKNKVIAIGYAENSGSYAREMIPQFNNVLPLNDIAIAEMGEINPYTGEIFNGKLTLKDWKECYYFEITNKAVKDETEAPKETDKE